MTLGLLHSPALLQHLGEPLRQGQVHVDESVDAVGDAGFRLAVEATARLVHARVPAHVVELVHLSTKTNDGGETESSVTEFTCA